MRPTKSQRTRHPRDRFACPAKIIGIGPRHGALLPAAAVAVALAACAKAEPDAPRAAPVAQAIAAPATPPAVAPWASTVQTESAPEATGDPFAGVDPLKSDVLRNIARLEAAPSKAAPRPPTANRAELIDPPSAAAEAPSAPVTVREAQAPTLAPPVAALSVEAPVAATTVAATPATPSPAPAAAPTTASVTPAAVASVTPSSLATGPRRALAQPRPEFPREALREGISEGRVVANLAIAADGRVTDVAVLSATPSRAFGRAAQQALRDWRYEAATAPSSVQVELVFRIE